jgi:RNA polymerase sigma factor (sigma-70 family)
MYRCMILPLSTACSPGSHCATGRPSASCTTPVRRSCSADAESRADDRPDPLGLLEQAADALHLRRCIDDIDGPQRQCLALAYYHGLSHSELAAHLGSPVGSVKAWLRRGVDRLRRCLERLE